jgi:hypothetical protein
MINQSKVINIIGDCAGRFDELQLLLAKMPEAELTVLVGDLTDRGSQSKQVVQWCMDNQGKVQAIRGNHEMLMIYGVENGDTSLWFHNGGWNTVVSYGGALELIPKEHISYLKSRPLYIETEELFISHAPVSNFKLIPKNPFSQDYNEVEDFVWDRIRPPRPYGDKMMVYGHNGRLNTTTYIDGEGQLSVIAECIDNCSKSQLCGMHWDGNNKDLKSKYRIYSQDYLTK